MNNPLVSIIIPCYNQADFLEEALNSVFKQTYQNWECIIVNDGSTDDTKKIAQYWKEKDSRFICLDKLNGGLSSARNAGLEIIKGDYVQFLDADDYLAKDKFELSLNKLNSFKNRIYNCIITDFKIVFQNTGKQENLKLNPKLFHLDAVLYDWDDLITIPIHCGFFEAVFFKEFRFQEEIKAKEDWIMWVSFFRKGFKADYIDKPLVSYRKHDDSMTMVKNILPDYILAFQFMKTILTENEYNKLSINLFSKYYKKSIQTKKELVNIKTSTSYKINKFVKRLFSKLKILKSLKYLVEILLKFKSK